MGGGEQTCNSTAPRAPHSRPQRLGTLAQQSRVGQGQREMITAQQTPDDLGQHTRHRQFTEIGLLAKWTSGELLIFNLLPAPIREPRKPEPPFTAPRQLVCPRLAARQSSGPGALPARGLAALGQVPPPRANQRGRRSLTGVSPAGRGCGRDGGAVRSAPSARRGTGCAPPGPLGLQDPAPGSCSSRLLSPLAPFPT